MQQLVRFLKHVLKAAFTGIIDNNSLLLAFKTEQASTCHQSIWKWSNPDSPQEGSVLPLYLELRGIEGGGGLCLCICLCTVEEVGYMLDGSVWIFLF